MSTLRESLLPVHRFLVPEDKNLPGWVPYFSLVYLLFFFVQWFGHPPTTLEVVLAAVTMAVFIPLYFSLYWRRHWAAFWHLLAMVGLGLAWAPFTVGAAVFFIYAACFTCQLGPTRLAFKGLAGIIAVAVFWSWLLDLSVFFWFWAVFFSLVMGAATIGIDAHQRKNDALRLSREEVQQLARVAERERIARDMHDILGHSLLLVVLKSELAGKLLKSDPQRAAEEIKTVEEKARQALNDVREAIGGYRERSLTSELEQARLVLQASDIELLAELDEALSLCPQTEAVLAMVLREAVTNVARHSGAHRCWASITADTETGDLLLQVRDDGNGGIRAEGAGIEGMRLRVESLGGSFEVDSRHSLVRARLPHTRPAGQSAQGEAA